MSAIAQESFDLIHRLVLAVLFEERFCATVKHELIQCLKWQSATMDPLSALVSKVSGECWRRAEREIQDAKESKVGIISVFDPLYPKKLLQVYDPPVLLFVRGCLTVPAPASGVTAERTVAVVGTRRATPYGVRNAFRIAREITHSGAVVVSGLALGIDTAAHEGAIDACKNVRQSELFDRNPSPGIAVLGSGVLNIYPRENVKLAHALIDAGGCVMSEYGLKAAPLAHFFPERNRIISGISDAVVVVEAPSKSGAMITARLALEEGREVLAVPGPADSAMSEGPHELIRSGAGIVTSVDDLLNVAQWYSRRKSQHSVRKHRSQVGGAAATSREKSATSGQGTDVVALVNDKTELAAEEKSAAIAIVRFLKTHGATDFEQLVAIVSQEIKITPTALTALISWLEIEGVITTGAGSMLSLAEATDG